MRQKKTLGQRQAELQALLASQAGKAELKDLASRYAKASGRPQAAKRSIITYILVYERTLGLIDG
jgi:hypothetical protein